MSETTTITSDNLVFDGTTWTVRDGLLRPSSAQEPEAPLPAPRYGHVLKALYDRPWAIQPQMLSFMTDLVRFRAAGGLLSEDEIAKRLAAAEEDNGPRAGAFKAGAVAVIPMYGVISQRTSLMSSMSGGTSTTEMTQLLRSALADDSVRAIVFDIDSPGGSTDGLPEFAAEIRRARDGSKPIVGQVNTLSASAAYWAAAQMTEIVVTPSGEVGSIGVFAAHQDMSKAEEQAGVKVTYISAGKFKTEGNASEPLGDEARAAIQDQIDEFYAMFLADVAKGRKVSVDTVRADYGEGRTLLAKKALAAGMVDRIDTLEATVRRLQPAKAAPVKRGRMGLELSADVALVAELAAIQSQPDPEITPPQLPIAAVAASTPRQLQPDAAWNQRMKGLRRR